MKIHIIGGSGSGKTYMSNKLKELLGIEVIDLDLFEWSSRSKNFSMKRPIEKRKTLLKEALSNKKDWIVEGIYYNWCEESFKNSDYIFYLTTPLSLQQFRIILRSIKRKLKLEDSIQRESLQSVYKLLKWNRGYNTYMKKEIEAYIQGFNDKLYYVRTCEDIKKIIRR